MSNPYQNPPQDPYGHPQQQPTQAYGYPQQPPAPQAQYGYPVQPQGYPTPAYPQQPVPMGAPTGAPPMPGYPQQYAAGPTGEPNILANAAVALGLVSVIGLFLYGIGGIFGLPGIGVGIAALRKSRITGTGRNLAIGGIVLSVLGILIGLALIAVVIKFVSQQS